MKNLPLVSVIVPSYNHEKYIAKCIKSIFSQTYENIELIVIDDGSSDASVRILKELQIEFSFLLIEQKNVGISRTLNRGINDFASGEYITFCASDDYFEDSKIEDQVGFLEFNKNYQLCFSKCYYINGENRILTNEHLYSYEPKYHSGKLFDDILLFNFSLPVTFMYTKSVLLEFNGFLNDVYCEDYYMALKISFKYPIGFIDKYHVFYRFSKNSSDKDLKIIESQKSIIDLYKKDKNYVKAVTRWKIRSLNTFSSHNKLKRKCFPLFLNFSLIGYKAYWKSLLRVLLKWQG